jgi:methionine-rich copper-binding protein CopC
MKKILSVLTVFFALAAVCATFAACEIDEPKTQLETPTIVSQVYTGSKLTAIVPQNDGYEIVSNEGGTDVGEYDVVLKLSDETNYEWVTPDSDDATKVTLKFAITKAPNQITALSLEGWTYGEEPKMPVATALFGTPTFAYGATADGTFVETVPTAAGSYFVKAKVVATANYDGAEKTAEFKIARAKAVLTTKPTAVANLVYTGDSLNLITAGVVDGGTMQYKLGVDGIWSSEIPTATNAGEYTVYYKVLGDDSHSDLIDDEKQQLTVTIAKADAQVTAPTAKTGLTYNGESQALIVAGSAVGATIEYKLGDGEWTINIPAATDAGEYTVIYRAVSAANYNVVDTEQQLTVTIAKADVQVTAPTAKTGLKYNGESQALIVAGSAIGATIEYKLGDAEWSTDIPTATDAGEYTVIYKIIAAANYNVVDGENKFTITIAKIADSIDFSLDNVTVRCGDSVPELTATSASGTAVTFTYSDNGNDYYTKEQLADFAFIYGTTYYVKAAVADSTNYTGTEKVLTITPQHNITVSESDGLQTAACKCGKKDVTGTLGTKQTIDLVATVDNGNGKATDGKLDLTTIGYNGNAEVTLTADEATYYATVQNGVVSLATVLPLGIYGEKAFGISVTDQNETYNVIINALVVTMTITTSDQYANWITIAKACEQSATLWGGYFRLGANITATSMIMFNRGKTDGTEGFKGVFDGCGYVIDGLNRSSWDSNAFVTTMTETGVLKNIAFTNVKITGEGNFLTSGGKGTIENVYVQYTEISAGSQYNGTIANFKDGCAMRNVFIDASKATVVGSGATFRILTSGTAGGFGGVFGVCPSVNYDPAQAIGDRGNNYAAIAYFANFDELKANETTQEVLAGWNNNGFWIVNDGIPAPKKYVVNRIDLGAKDIDLDILVDNDTVKLNDNALEIDCMAVGFTFGNVASVTMEGNAIDTSGFTFANGKLTVARSAFGFNYGEKEIVVTDDSGKTITIAATLISKVLKNATDYANWIKIANACETENQILGGYFKLGANITSATMVTFERWDVDGAYGFKGIFDGCGYAIDGLTATGNAFISCMTKDGVLRNIAFTNAKIAGESNFLCSGGLGTIENVYVQYVSISAGSDYNGTIYNHCRSEQEGGKITNVFVDASQAVISGTGASFRLLGGSNTGYNGIFAVCPEGYTITQARDTGTFADHAVCAFADFDELKANETTQSVIKDWDSAYWTIVDGVPVFLTK